MVEFVELIIFVNKIINWLIKYDYYFLFMKYVIY